MLCLVCGKHHDMDGMNYLINFKNSLIISLLQMRKLKCKWVKITPLMEVSGPGAEPRPSGAEKNLNLPSNV